jgi:hypothetical protein
MIEQAVLTYLLSEVGSLVNNQIYYHRVPANTKMPWIIITNSGGMRRKQTQDHKTEATDVLTIYVDDNQQFRGKTIADAVQTALENYRGDMPPAPATPIAYDTFFRTATTRDLDDPFDAFRYLLTVYCIYRFPTTTH